MSRPYVDIVSGESIPEIWLRIHAAFPDLREAYPDPLGRDRESFISWARFWGRKEWEYRVGRVAPKIVVGMVVNPDLRCGIREHTGYFAQHLATPIETLSQDPAASNHQGLLGDAKIRGVTTLHIQHEFSLFRDMGAFSFLLQAAKEQGFKTVLDFHTGDLDGGERLKFSKTWAGLVHKVVVHSPKVAEDLTEFNPIQIPLALPDQALWHRSLDKVVSTGAPIVATFGFHGHHKGFKELVLSMGVVRNRFPGAWVVVIGSHNFPWQDLYFTEVLRAVENTGPGHAVLLDEFLSIEEVIRTLAVADVVVLPYRIHAKSQSGAVETAILSGRPIVASATELFAHIPDDHFAARFPHDVDVAGMGRVVRDTLEKNLVPTSVRKSLARATERRGSVLASIYDTIYKSLEV